MELVILLTILFWAVIPGVITGWMFRERGWSLGLGFLLGILSGPLGILVSLVLIFVSDRRSRGVRGKAYRLYYHFPVVGRLHVSTVWMLAGVATFLCVWALGGLWYELQLARQNFQQTEKASQRAAAKTQGQQLAPSNPQASAAQAGAKPSAAAQSNPTSSPSAPLVSSLASQPGQTAQAPSRSDNAPAQASQPAAPDSSNNMTTAAAGVAAAPAAPPATQPAASPQPTNPPGVSRQAAISEVTRGLGARGHSVHASVSGDAQTSTLSLSGATLTREAGNQVIGNRRVRESLKAAGVRIVVMINGQESWTYML